MKTFASAVALMLAGAYAFDMDTTLEPITQTWSEGTCPQKDQNKKNFDLYKMAGLWFEYVWEDNLAVDMDHYVCSSSLWLDEGDGSYIVYNSFQFPAPEELVMMKFK